jgi:hypothetical protein
MRIIKIDELDERMVPTAEGRHELPTIMDKRGIVSSGGLSKNDLNR